MVGWTMALAILAGSMLIGWVAQPGTGPIVIVERFSAILVDALRRWGNDLPIGYAVVAGAIAVFNPCGIALVPVYVGLFLGDDAVESGATLPRMRRAIIVSAVVALSFGVVFAGVGLLVGIFAVAVGTALPWIGLAVGILLVLLGGRMLAGGAPLGVAIDTARMGRAASSGGLRGYSMFGVGYAAASLGCTLPIFIAATGSSLAGGSVGTTSLRFIGFGAGMALALGVLTVVFGLAGGSLIRRIGRGGDLLEVLSAALVLLAGAYIIVYWLSSGTIG